MIQRVIIEDLQEKAAVDISDTYQYRLSKEMIKNEHKASEAIPRDSFVWIKNISQRNLLKKCKENYKKEMLLLYPHFTNKKMIVNLRIKV